MNQREGQQLNKFLQNLSLTTRLIKASLSKISWKKVESNNQSASAFPRGRFQTMKEKK